MIEPAQVRRVAIVGAGVAGLATARRLLAQGLECTVFERSGELGGVWSTGYLNFGLQVQSELYEFPDWPLPEGTPDFAPGPIIKRYLADFADHFGVTPRIRFHTEVTRIEEGEGAATGWILTTRHGGREERDRFDWVVVCIGVYSQHPKRPRFPGESDFGGEILHISELQTAEQLAGKRVAVLGYGKSATDAALEAAAVARESHIVFRDPHWPLPPRLLGVLPFKWGMLTRLASALIAPYQHPTPPERVLHTLGKPLVWFYWRLVEAMIRFQCRLGSRFGTRVDLVPDLPAEIDGFAEGAMLPRGDFYRLVRRGAITPHRSAVEAYSDREIRLRDGTAIEVDVVVLATGWTIDFSFLADTVLERLGLGDDGLYLYRHMVHPEVPGLVFVGYASTVSDILTRSLQARWLGDLLAGRFQLPPADVTRSEIEHMKQWKRALMPFSPVRGARIMVHMQHYHDELLRDFGASPLRKTGTLAPVKELIVPYLPRDYAEVVSPEP